MSTVVPDVAQTMEVEGAPAVPSEPIGEAEEAAPRAATTDVAPSAPGITSHDDVQAEEEDAEEMVRIQGTRDTAGERVRFERKQILLAYAGIALPAGLDPLPAFGLGAAAPWGDYFAYVKSGQAVAFRTACEGKLPARAPDGETYELKVSALSISDVNKEESGVRSTRAETDRLAVHIICHLEMGAEFRLVKKRDLKASFVEAGFVCFLTTQAHVKMVEDQTGAIAGTETEEIHLNVRPRHGSFLEHSWPVRAHVTVKAGKFTEAKRDFYVRYSIMKHEQLPEDKFCRVHKEKKVGGKCARCKAPRTESDSQPAAKKQKMSRDDVMASIIAQAQAAPGKEVMSREEMAKTECQSYMLGKCSYVRTGATCPRLHDPLVPPEMIECDLPKSKFSKKCGNRGKCLYKGCFQRSLQRIPMMQGATPEKSAAPGAKRRMVPRAIDSEM